MGTSRLTACLVGCVAFFSALLGANGSPGSVRDQVSISSIRANSPGASTVSVHVPRGTRRVSLQVLETNKWVTRAIAHVDGSGKDVKFQIPRNTNKNRIRITSSTKDTLPTNFFKGKANFASTSNSSTPYVVYSDGMVVASDKAITLGATTAQPAVTEADIWKINGTTLFFFNQYRGLQIIDITHPDDPVLNGKLRLPAVGEDMYVIDPHHVILLARKGNNWSQSELISVVIDDGTPSIAARLPITGSIDTSRMVGTALYVASQGWQASSSSPYGTYGTRLSSFDLSNPSAPIARTSLWRSGYGNKAMVANNYLFAATTTNWSNSDICVVDISAPNGTMVATGTIHTAGMVKDQFKMGVNGSVFTVISEIWPGWNQPVSTKLETFSISNPANPVKLGELGFGSGDWLYGTRICGNLAYVVTAVNIDPLWIIDLSDPAAPAIKGKLEVPGHSTYLQPLGSKLLTIGVLNSKVAVSLFDVDDPTAPALLTQLSLGGTYAWSEANFDEKAFTVLPDAGLALVPVNSYDPTSGEASQVQLIDIGANALTKRGVINAQFSPRRATSTGNRLLAISGRELLTVNDANRDNPSVTSNVALSWPVNQVFIQGNYLLEVESGGGWWRQSATVVRVTPADDPETVLTEIGRAHV